MPELRDSSDRWLAAALFAAGFALLFRGWLFSGFDGAFGDDEDGYLALALIEHWHHVFLGATDWMDLFAFYPQHGTLGYTDAFFLFGAAYAPLRILGADAFTAYMLVMVALAVAGSLASGGLRCTILASLRPMRRLVPSCSPSPTWMR